MPNEITIQRLKSVVVDESQPRPIILLGAGASRRSGVPLAGQLVEQMARLGYCRENDISPKDQSVTQSDWQRWLHDQKWFMPEMPVEDRYVRLVDEVLRPAAVRKHFFERTIREVHRPSDGYEALASLVGKGWITTILTTNFDELAHTACRANVHSALALVIHGPENANLISSDPSQPQIVHLHGSVQYYSDCNLADEVEHLHPDYVDALLPLLRDHPLIVVGYRGAERSVMQDLLLRNVEGAGGYRYGIYWCALEDEDLHANVIDLDRAAPGNVFTVRISGFDDTIKALDEGSGRSGRVASALTVREVPETAATELGEDDVAWHLAEREITTVARALELPAASQPSRGWFMARMVELNLARDDGPTWRLTRAGELLFSRHAPIQLHFRSPRAVRQLRGNIIELIAETLDLLSHLNEPFRVKLAKSSEVRFYPPLALKEIVVNALAHRDFERLEPIEVLDREGELVLRSPGSVLDAIKPADLGRSRVQAYRNPWIANVLYATGDMDKAGSGLVDVRRWSQDNGGDAFFTSDEDLEWFEARLVARPERPGEGLATPDGDYQIFYANALPLRFRNPVLSVASTWAEDRYQVFQRIPGERTPPFVVRGKTLFTLADLDQSEALRSQMTSDIEHVSLDEVRGDPDLERTVVELLNESVRRHAKDLGLLVHGRDQRLYFPRVEAADDDDTAAGDRYIDYHGRVKDSRRRVVTVRRSPSGRVSQWEHQSVHWQVRRFGEEWHLLLVPGWTFTRDGYEQPIDRKRIGPLSTRRSAREYNANVTNHLFFWSAVLTGQEVSCVLQDGSKAVELVAAPLSAHLVGAPAALGAGDDEADDLDLDDLDDLEGDVDAGADVDVEIS